MALLLRYIGLPGCAILALLFFYEGVPIAGRLPLVAELLPSGLIRGRVQTFADEKVKAATSEMVGKYELMSVQAELINERIKSAAAQRESELLKVKAAKDAEKLRELDSSSKTLPLPTKEELQWFDLHFSQP